MSDTNAQEPTMEEILASIRRIISEDEAPPAAVEPAPPPPEVHAPVEPPAPAPVDDDVLELTDPLDAPHHVEAPAEPEPAPNYSAAPPMGSLGDLDFSSSSPSASVAPPARPEEPLVSGHAASAAASSFGQLSRSIGMPADGRTLEDVVMVLLRPLLKDWLDNHLPGIVEAKVQAEVERISRGR